MNLISKIFSIFNRHEQLQCVGLLVFTMLGAIFEAVGISGILPLVSMMADENFLVKHKWLADFFADFGIVQHKDVLIIATVALMLFFLLKNIYMFILAYLQMKFTFAKQNYYASALTRLYLAKPYLYHVEKNTAELIRNVQNNTPYVFTYMLINCFMLITEIFMVIAIWLMLMYVDMFTATIAVGVLATLIYILIKSIKHKLTKQGIIQQKYNLEMAKSLHQGLGAIKETKVLCKEEYFAQSFADNFAKYNNANLIYQLINQLPRFCIESVVMMGLLALIIYKLMSGQPASQIVPMLSLLALAAFRLMPSANRIVNQYNTLRYLLPTLDTVYADFMQIKNNPTSQLLLKKDTNPLEFTKKLEINNVTFNYPQNKTDVLSGVTFTIPQGSFVGIVGSSGAGKTTFVDILLGLLEPKCGQILADGQNIFSSISRWQSILAYVPQTIYLVDGSIKENIALGEDIQHISEEKIVQALKMAELWEFVQALPDNINAKVGERGVKLSGGQRQRIGIARALYQNPKVLILDEATSALDSQTEKNITQTILKLKGQLTIIAIAHRLSTLEQCDFKVKFVQGKAEVVE